jgi:hypothetical protein
VPGVNFQCAPTHRKRPLPRVIVLCMSAPVQTSSVSRQVAVGPAAARVMPGRVAPSQPTPEAEGPGTAAPAIRPSHQRPWQQHPGRSCEATTVSPLDARTGPPTRSIRTDARSRSFADGRVDNPAGRLSADPKAVGCPFVQGVTPLVDGKKRVVTCRPSQPLQSHQPPPRRPSTIDFNRISTIATLQSRAMTQSVTLPKRSVTSTSKHLSCE